MTVESCDGGTMNCSASANWTGGNGIFTNDGGGVFQAVKVGQATMSASDFLVAEGRRNNCCDTCPENQLSASNTVTVGPGLTITMGLNGSSPSGAGISGSTQSIVIGQQVQLQANYNLTGGTLTSESWSVQGTTASQWTPGSNPAPISTGNNLTTIYWTAPGNGEAATFTLNYNDANGSPQVTSGTVNFNAAGPSGATVATALSGWDITSNGLELGDPQATPGIAFSASASAPAGATNNFTWAQVLTSLSASCTVAGTRYAVAEPSTPALDNVFPYGSLSTTADSPSIQFFSIASDETDTIAATMYLMWNPGLASDLRVPLGYTTWTASGHATVITNLWQVQGDSTQSAMAFNPSSAYPIWNQNPTISSPFKLTCSTANGAQSLRNSVAARDYGSALRAWPDPPRFALLAPLRQGPHASVADSASRAGAARRQ